MDLQQNHLDKLKNILPKIIELRGTQRRFLTSRIIYEEDSDNIEDYYESSIKIKKMSINKSLKETGIISKANTEHKDGMCIICFQSYSQNELVRELKCKHQFHKKCIDKWFYPKYHEDEELSCPICRQDTLSNL